MDLLLEDIVPSLVQGVLFLFTALAPQWCIGVMLVVFVIVLLTALLHAEELEVLFSIILSIVFKTE